LRVLPFILLLSFVVSGSLAYSKEIPPEDNDKKSSADSLHNPNQTGKHQLKYALRFNNHYDANLYLSETTPGKSSSKPTGIVLEDGTTWNYESDLNSTRLFTLLGLTAVVDVAGYYRLKDLWYDWPTSKFHTTDFKLDFITYKLMDKYGHFLHSFFVSDFFSRGYRWSGISGENSVYYGALSGWLWMLQIEIADGFFEAWGFSWGDLMFNTFGSGFSLMQQLYPEALGGLQPKVSYHESDALRERKYNNGTKSIIDDYEGITWWLCANVYHYMPENIQKNYPAWLKPFGLAVGYSAHRIANDPQGGERVLLLGLDYDLRKLSFGENNNLLKFLKNELNIIRLPLPAIQITPNGIWYGLYF